MLRTMLSPVRSLPLAACGVLLLASVAIAGADDADYAAFIYQGTCTSVAGPPVAELDDLEDGDDDIWRVIGNDEARPNPFWGEEEDIEPLLAELTGEPHVLVIRADDDQRAAVVACGEISGPEDARGELMISLEEVDRSGIEGRAHFAPSDDDDDDDQTDVTTGVWRVPGGTPAASPQAIAAS